MILDIIDKKIKELEEEIIKNKDNKHKLSEDDLITLRDYGIEL
jgi:hypothetical protein